MQAVSCQWIIRLNFQWNQTASTVLVTVVILKQNREKRIFVSGTLTLQKALLASNCLNDWSHGHYSTLPASARPTGFQCLQCLTRKRTFRWTEMNGTELLVWVVVFLFWIDLVKGRFSNSKGHKISNWKVTGQRKESLDCLKIHFPFYSEQCYIMYLSFQKASHTRCKEVIGFCFTYTQNSRGC